jgi:hypothetical protein
VCDPNLGEPKLGEVLFIHELSCISSLYPLYTTRTIGRLENYRNNGRSPDWPIGEIIIRNTGRSNDWPIGEFIIRNTCRSADWTIGEYTIRNAG